MVEIRIRFGKGVAGEGAMARVEASGHALFDKKGKDLVCCAVSVELQSFHNGIAGLCKVEHESEKSVGFFSLTIKKTDEKSLFLLKYLMLNLKILENEYKGHLKVIVEEEDGR